MNFKMKALVAAAVVATTMSGAANALTNNEMFLVAYDAVASKTFIAALGQAGSVSAFTGNTNLSVNYAADANWTNFITGATAGGVTYQVLGVNQTGVPGAYAPADKLLMTSSALPGSFTNGGMNALMNDASQPTGTFIGLFESLSASVTGTSTSLVLGAGDDSGFAVRTNFFGQYTGTLDTTAALGSDLGFYSVTRPAGFTKLVQTIKTQYLQGAAGSAGDTWNLSSTGALTYTAAAVAAVPEADTSAMFLAGLGLMGFVARRRTRG
jgi:hypothetical protein